MADHTGESLAAAYQAERPWRRRRLLLSLLFPLGIAFVLILGMLGGVQSYFAHAATAKDGVPVKARVLEVIPRPASMLRYEYEVNGTRYEKLSGFPRGVVQSAKVGGEVDIVYSASNPSQSHSPEDMSPGLMIALVFAFIAVPWGLRAWGSVRGTLDEFGAEERLRARTSLLLPAIGGTPLRSAIAHAEGSPVREIKTAAVELRQHVSEFVNPFALAARSADYSPALSRFLDQAAARIDNFPAAMRTLALALQGPLQTTQQTPRAVPRPITRAEYDSFPVVSQIIPFDGLASLDTRGSHDGYLFSLGTVDQEAIAANMYRYARIVVEKEEGWYFLDSLRQRAIRNEAARQGLRTDFPTEHTVFQTIGGLATPAFRLNGPRAVMVVNALLYLANGTPWDWSPRKYTLVLETAQGSKELEIWMQEGKGLEIRASGAPFLLEELHQPVSEEILPSS